MQVAIEREKGEIASGNLFTALLGFRALGYEVHYFEHSEVDSLPNCPELVVVGYGGTITRALLRLKVALPVFPSIPKELERFAGRRTWGSSLGAVRRSVQSGSMPLFIKPATGHTKQFTGHVVRTFGDLLATVELPDETSVICSDVVSLKSEYRCFVHRGSLVGCKHYGGSFRHFPDFHIIDEAVAAFVSAPAAYSLDVGVTANGGTLLVEVNDAYALGAYGLEPAFYAKMLADRWHELVGGYGRITA